jgi:tetratricopeptide (TPR) repeat protein
MNQYNDAKKKALVIGISDYNNLQSLDFCKNDGNAISEVLASLGYKIDTSQLIGYVQWQTMRDAIFDFFADPNIKPDDTLIFYYSGHGIPDSNGDIYFSSSEIDPKLPHKRGFAFYELTKVIQNCFSRKIVVILDSCHSGSAKISKGHEEDEAKLGMAAINRISENFKSGDGVCLLASSQPYQDSYKLEGTHHSLFSYFLLEGLKGDIQATNTEGYITVDSLSKYVYDKIIELPESKRPKQKPLKKIESSGDVVLAFFPKFKRLNSNPTISLENFAKDDKGKELIEKGDYQSAVDYYETLTQNSNLAYIWDKKGIALHKLCNDDEALQCFEICTLLDKTNADGWEHKGVNLHNRGQFDKALECFNKSIIYTKTEDTNVSQSNRWWYKGMCLENKGLVKEALECFNVSIELNPNAEFALAKKGDILLNQDQLEEAEQYYDKALSILPDLSIAWNGKGLVMNKREKYSEAIICYENAIKYSNKNNLSIANVEITVLNMAFCYYNLKNYDQVIICTDKALKINPKSDLAWKTKGLMFQFLLKYDEALQCYDKVLEINPYDTDTQEKKQNIIKEKQKNPNYRNIYYSGNRIKKYNSDGKVIQ